MPKKLAVTPEEKKEDAPAPLLKISDIEQLGYITNMLHQLKSMANDQGHRMLSYMIELAEL